MGYIVCSLLQTVNIYSHALLNDKDMSCEVLRWAKSLCEHYSVHLTQT